MHEAQAAKYIAYYWGGAMVGRFIGALVMQKISGRMFLLLTPSVPLPWYSFQCFSMATWQCGPFLPLVYAIQ